MNTYEKLITSIPTIEEKIAYTFKDKKLLLLAFIHRSFINENRAKALEHNERLEFLGDSVLGLLMAEFLYRQLPTTSEGDLSNLRSRLVEAPSCMNYLLSLHVEEHILLGKGERLSDGRGRSSILADLFEAIVGAIFLDGGIESVSSFLFKRCRKEIDEILKTPTKNWKALLQDFSQKKYKESPAYKVIEETGPDHRKHFLVAVYIQKEEKGRGEGISKKQAEQLAAEMALKSIENGVS